MDFDCNIMVGSHLIEYDVNEVFLLYEIENGRMITDDIFWTTMSSIIQEFKIGGRPSNQIKVLLPSRSGGHYSFGTIDIDTVPQSFVSKEAICRVNINGSLYHLFQVIFVKDEKKIPEMINYLEHNQNEVGYIIKEFIDHNNQSTDPFI